MRGLQALFSILFAGAAPALAQAPPPAGFPGTPPQSPPAMIREFSALPTIVAAGASTTLRWEAINTYSLTLEPLIGPVATRGSERVTPTATTTFTLEATGAGGSTRSTVTVVVENRAGAPAPTPRPAPSPATTGNRPPPSIPRLADGTPDLSGVFIAERNLRLRDSVTLKPGAESFRVPTQEGDLGTGVTCLPPGVPQATMLPFPLQIVHRPDVLVVLYEAYHQFRVVPVGREHDDYLAPAFMGHSVARWDGDTLVVDVRGFNDKTVIAGHRHTEALHVTERYRRISRESIEYEALVEDPNVFAAPLRYAGTLTLHPEWEIGEYVCTENDQDYDALFETR
jgi:hypothetical protein